MFATGFVLGSITGTVLCLVSAVLHRLSEAGGPVAARPLLVPLHVTGVSRASLN
jgi:hypothetical protein